MFNRYMITYMIQWFNNIEFLDDGIKNIPAATPYIEIYGQLGIWLSLLDTKFLHYMLVAEFSKAGI